MTMARAYPWQKGLWSSLCGLAESGRMPHALLLAAPAGMGKQVFARALAQWQLCQQKTTDGACGVCRSCQLLQAGSHPDLMWVSPDTDGEKASKVIKIEQARAVVEFANQTAQMEGYRVVVISPADALNTSSANALLKTLEEPGQRSLFLLLTDKPAALLPTIRSRCQLLPLTVPDEQVAKAWLAESITDELQRETVWRLSRGAPEAAQVLAQSAWFAARAGVLGDLIAVAARKRAPLQAAASWQSLNAEDQMSAWHSVLDDAVQLQMLPDYVSANQDLHMDIAQLAQTVSAKAMLEALFEVVEARRLLTTNVQAQTIAESLWLRWATLTRPN